MLRRLRRGVSPVRIRVAARRIRDTRQGRGPWRPWEKALLASCLLSALALAGTAMALFDTTVDHPASPPDCQPAVLAEARMTAELTVVADNVDIPLIRSRFTVSMPVNWSWAGGVLGHPESAGYRRAMRCLFGAAEGERHRPWEERRRLPRVEIGGSTVTVADEVETYVSSADTATALGPWRTDLNATTWTLALAAPQALNRATWERIEVRLPADWPTGSELTPDTARAGVLTWTDKTALREQPVLALTPDFQARAVVAMSKIPGSTVTFAMEHLSYAGVLAWALVVVRRAREEEPWRAEHPRRSAGSDSRRYLAAASGRAHRILLLQVGVSLAIVADMVVYDGLTSAGILDLEPWNSVYNVLDVLLWAFLIISVAGLSAFRIRPRSAVLMTFAPFVAGVLGFPLSGYVITLVVVMTVLQLFHAMRARPLDEQAGPVPRWVALGGIAITTAAAAVFVNHYAQRLPHWNWLDHDVEPFDEVINGTAWHAWDVALILTDLLAAVTIVAVIAQLHARTAVRGPLATGRDLALVSWVFAAATFDWTDSLLGTSLPLSAVVAGLVLWLALTCTRPWAPLNRPGIRAAVERLPGTPLQKHAELLEEARRRYRQPRDEQDEQHEPASGIDHVRLVFALGPHHDPWRTARFAAAVTGALGGVPAIWFLYTELSTPFWSFAGGQALGGLRVPALILEEILFWSVPGLLLGLLWRHLPGRAGAVKVLPIAVSYLVAALGHQVVSRIFGQDLAVWTVQRSLLVWGVLSVAAIAIDVKTVRLLERRPTTTRHDLAALYGVVGWPVRLTGVLPQVVAIALMIYVVLQPDAGLVQSDPLQVFKRAGGAP
ncbi:DUF6185 family protein [Nonomuraea rubra]|uniref:Uncharacterized protein n=1 Tax=Nonomuraea rubra TaxID=46180 RepID=A0A7X0NUJ7_9ACTN|nr:DUF6185 family protein [Nonomuraea rubra]MBB6549893.1 hypothetical protein [Nonomuraea rubra]